MRINLIIALFTLLPFFTLQAKEPAPVQIPGTEVIPIQDSKTKRQYDLYVKLPESYQSNNDKHYPVIYFTDAYWHIELLSAATFFLMEEVILVGVSWQTDISEQQKLDVGVYASRFRDFSIKPSTDPEKQAKYQYGQASTHLTFIRDDVFSYVEKHYRTKPDERTYFGFSMGGLFGSYALLTQPDMFKNYILGSPSIWRSAPDLFSWQSNALNSDKPEINVYISYGEQEEKLIQYVEGFVETLKKNKYKRLSRIEKVVIESAGHSDSFPSMAVKSIKWLSSLQPQPKVH
ncbi:alpha/beta hydrolase [Pseudoalteromonas sp. T1lg65]|uniref:alpha/beta hydrolase n=1 Tax=Pseudoalteromonas sp. T1lg65 TaxID=2077101 RepID=UPI003F78F08E